MIEKQKLILKRHDTSVHIKITRERACSECQRDKKMCLCGKVTSFTNRHRIVILQHPQEQFKIANSASLTKLILRNSTLLTGLSWKNFKAVAGEAEQPSSWAVLYLKDTKKDTKPVSFYNRNSVEIENVIPLRGIIAIDGSWKQAKTIWWRNPWFLKLNRISLNPDFQSFRHQSNEKSLSTIEAIAFLLKNLGEKPVISESLLYQYNKLISPKLSDCDGG